MRKYLITFRASETALPQLMTLRQRGVDLVSVQPDNAPQPTAIKAKPKSNGKVTTVTEELFDHPSHRFAGGKRDKGISAKALVINTITVAGRPLSRKELQKVFTSHQPPFSENTVDAVLSKMAQEGTIGSVHDQISNEIRYQLT